MSGKMIGAENFGATDDRGNVLHTKRPDRTVITMQPQHLESLGGRMPLPASTMNWRSTRQSQFIPMHGLDFLIGVKELAIQQTVYPGDLRGVGTAERRFDVRVRNGETLYSACESSSASSRMLCGPARDLTLRLHDVTRQEALVLHRRLAGSTCCFPCRLQEMKVISPPGDYLGRIQQQWSMFVPFYLVRDANDVVTYLVEGPQMKPFRTEANVSFKILSGDALTEQGSIVHAWDELASDFTLAITFPVMATEPKQKALLLAAAFLLEFTHFDAMKTKQCTLGNCL